MFYSVKSHRKIELVRLT